MFLTSFDFGWISRYREFKRQIALSLKFPIPINLPETRSIKNPHDNQYHFYQSLIFVSAFPFVKVQSDSGGIGNRNWLLFLQNWSESRLYGGIY